MDLPGCWHQGAAIFQYMWYMKDV